MKKTEYDKENNIIKTTDYNTGVGKGVLIVVAFLTIFSIIGIIAVVIIAGGL